MHPIDKQRKNNTIIKLVSGIIIVAGLGWLLSLFLGNDTPKMVDNDPVKVEPAENIIALQQRSLLMQDELLHARFDTLQKLDGAYTLMSGDTANKNLLTGLDTRIAMAEQSFLQSLDSVSKKVLTYPNEADEKLFINMIGSFRMAFENRRSLNILRKAINNDTAHFNDKETSMLQLQIAMLDKDAKIAYLENVLSLSKNKNSSYFGAADAGNTISKENNPPVENDEADENKIALLIAKNNALQKDYDRVIKQLQDARKNTGQGDVVLKEKNELLLYQLEDVNTELNLAKVDCNLTRVDATQIISTAKQRRLLLTEALSILNNLSDTKNDELQKKVKEKIARLNYIAKNYRD